MVTSEHNFRSLYIKTITIELDLFFLIIHEILFKLKKKNVKPYLNFN